MKLKIVKRIKKLFDKWEAAYRFTYNKAIDKCKEEPKIRKFDLRNILVTAKSKGVVNPFIQENSWLKETPKDIRQQAAFEAAKNFKQANNKCGYKKKESDWTLSLEKEHIKIVSPTVIKFYSYKRKTAVRTFGQIPKALQPSDLEDFVKPPCQVLLQRKGRSYYLVLPYKYQKKDFYKEGHMVAIDPGMRKFLTTYGTDGRVGFFGLENPLKQMKHIQYFKDKILEQIRAKKKSIERATGKERSILKKKFKHLKTQQDNIRSDFHHKVAKWLTDHYQLIVIGKLPKGIISRDKSLPKIVKRAFNSLAHYKFRCCLKDKCIAKGIVYQEQNESYTSKTCTNCGKLNNVGSSEIYHCDCSSKPWDRDVNGARNILLKSFNESYLRFTVKNGKTLSFRKPSWTQNPAGSSLCIDILKDV